MIPPAVQQKVEHAPCQPRSIALMNALFVIAQIRPRSALFEPAEIELTPEEVVVNCFCERGRVSLT
jgi:hypothetical protein